MGIPANRSTPAAQIDRVGATGRNTSIKLLQHGHSSPLMFSTPPMMGTDDCSNIASTFLGLS